MPFTRLNRARDFDESLEVTADTDATAGVAHTFVAPLLQSVFTLPIMPASIDAR
jgi:hypothetical protein